MSERHTVGLELLHPTRRGPHTIQHVKEIRVALPGATIGDPDEAGFFEVELDADSWEDALQKVFDAIAAAGADDHVVIAEHPDVPEHWRRRAS